MTMFSFGIGFILAAAVCGLIYHFEINYEKDYLDSPLSKDYD